MKIYPFVIKENWICDRIAEEWQKYNPDVTVNNPKEADILWILAAWGWTQISPDLLKEKKVVLTIHHIVPDKFDQQKYDEFRFRDQFVDVYHVPNNKTAFMVRNLTNKPIYVIPYWYNEETWYPEDKDEARISLGLPENKFIVGSFQRDTEGNTNLPKLEKGPDLFCDFLEKLKDKKDLHVLLGGWRRGYIIERLKEMKIDYTFYETAPISVIRSMYNSCDLYVVASRFEGGPQAVLEAAATKVPIISRDVGIATEVLSPYCILDIPKQVDLPSQKETEFNFNNVKRFEIKRHKENYLSIFKGVLE
jgi:glycosyltransferase involved in cell wall biosynthesis